ncbi:MAG: UDP-N-acetylglucosamine 2-epimerase (hydrolyzing) [Rhodospirillales bacterium]|nr:UDP-N-acetylglucosamine 2-epimerase (hydrolyzing) [Rhodospirillales bacterium]
MSGPRRKILFVTGTRADFGKLKPLIRAIDGAADFDCAVFVTGMHTLDLYGHTQDEVYKAGFRDIHVHANQAGGEPMEIILANTVVGLSGYVEETRPDMIVVHGDRVEALAGTIVGALRNVLVGHIEGGEISGTVDELIRHAASKLSHLHFVANEEAAQRLRQLGEVPGSIFVIGSPDIDVMVSADLAPLADVKAHYEIAFENYAIAIFHPVTTEAEDMAVHAEAFVDALIESGSNYLVVYPNNDYGCEAIFAALKRLEARPSFRIFRSLRFEYFLTLLKNAELIVGNSSAGIREAPFYGLPTVNVGTRQENRYHHPSIVNVGYRNAEIAAGIAAARAMGRTRSSRHFGNGDSHVRFLDILRRDATWRVSRQKQFRDIFAPVALMADSAAGARKASA